MLASVLSAEDDLDFSADDAFVALLDFSLDSRSPLEVEVIFFTADDLRCLAPLLDFLAGSCAAPSDWGVLGFALLRRAATGAGLLPSCTIAVIGAGGT